MNFDSTDLFIVGLVVLVAVAAYLWVAGANVELEDGDHEIIFTDEDGNESVFTFDDDEHPRG